jgi:hypothetical protein
MPLNNETNIKDKSLKKFREKNKDEEFECWERFDKSFYIGAILQSISDLTSDRINILCTHRAVSSLNNTINNYYRDREPLRNPFKGISNKYLMVRRDLAVCLTNIIKHHQQMVSIDDVIVEEERRVSRLYEVLSMPIEDLISFNTVEGSLSENIIRWRLKEGF